MKLAQLITVILLSLGLSSCTNTSDLKTERLLADEMKSVSASDYGLFISKHKSFMSEEVLQGFQDIYYTKPAGSEKKVTEVFCMAKDGTGMALYRMTNHGKESYRVVVTEYTDKVNSFKVNTLYGV